MNNIDRNTVVRVAIPLSLYESVKGKILNEELAPADKNRRYIVASEAGTGKKVEEAENMSDIPDPEVNQNYKTGANWDIRVTDVYDGKVVLDFGGMVGKIKMPIEAFKKKIKAGQATLQPEKPRHPNTSTFYVDEAKKPSAGLTKKEKSAVAKKAKAGKDIGKSGKGFEKVAKKAAKEYGSKEKGQKVAAAAMWKAQAAKKK